MRRGHTGRGGIEELVVTSPAGKQENVSAGGSGFEEVLESNRLLPGSVYQSVCLIISVYTEGNGNTATGHSRACRIPGMDENSATEVQKNYIWEF